MHKICNSEILPKLVAICIAVSVTSPSLATSRHAPTSRLHGTVALPVVELSEIIEEIEVPSQGKLQKTGTIRLSLDPEAKRPQQMVLDFGKMKVSIQSNQLLNAPLLEAHGLKPMRLAIDEAGDFELLGLTYDKRNRSASATLAMRVGANVPFVEEPFKGALAKNYKVDKCSYPANKCRRISLVLDGMGGVMAANVEQGDDESQTSVDRGEFIFGEATVPFQGERIMRVGSSAASKGGKLGGAISQSDIEVR